MHRQQNTASGPELTILSWSAQFDEAIIYHNSNIVAMNLVQMRDSILAFDRNRTTSQDLTSSNSENMVKRSSILLISPQRSLAYQIQVSTDATTSGTKITNYEFFITCLRAGESWARSAEVKHVVSPLLYYPPSEIQYACAAEDSRITYGCIELDICHADERLAITIRDPKQTTFQRALKSFKMQAHPFKPPRLKSIMASWIQNDSVVHYAIFENTEISFEVLQTSQGEGNDSFLANGSNTVQDKLHIFQFSRCLDKEGSTENGKQARRFEVFVSVFDERRDAISWFIHTTTGGEISLSKNEFPETAWALHPRLPLLAYLIPGHRLKVSHIESQHSPITITGKIDSGSFEAKQSADLFFQSL
jgi:hypothetical protein